MSAIFRFFASKAYLFDDVLKPIVISNVARFSSVLRHRLGHTFRNTLILTVASPPM